LIQIGGKRLNRVQTQPGGTGRDIAVELTMEGFHQRIAFVSIEVDLIHLGRGQGFEHRELVGTQNVQNVECTVGQKTGVVPVTIRRIVPKILKSPVIGHLAGRKECLRFECAGDHHKTVKSDRSAPGIIRQGLGDVHLGCGRDGSQKLQEQNKERHITSA
jgi:hypothetical protein